MKNPTKADIAAEARSLGLNDQGTKAEIQGRINAYWEAMEEAGHDTEEALYQDLNDLHPVAGGNTKEPMKIHLEDAALLTGAIAVAAHLAHLM
ncbi:MAG: hypothetical protein HC890_07795 [Chloroflexaceae bacterium]|nr:hypothetical protein [Chloroflexaceae bacterium]